MLRSSLHQLFHRLAAGEQEALSRLTLWRAARIGARPRVLGMPFIQNLGRIEIGDDFHMASRPVQSHLVTGPQGHIEIGNRVVIAEGAAVTSENHIRIGDGAYLGPFTILMDTDFHDSSDHNAASATAPIIIEADVHLERDVTVLKGTTIGRGARVAAGSVVSGTIAPGAFVKGVPARAVRSGSTSEGASADEIAARVKRIVVETFASEHEPQLDDGPATMANWDSLGALRLLVALEDEFQLSFADDALGKQHTVGEIIELIAQRV